MLCVLATNNTKISRCRCSSLYSICSFVATSKAVWHVFNQLVPCIFPGFIRARYYFVVAVAPCRRAPRGTWLVQSVPMIICTVAPCWLTGKAAGGRGGARGYSPYSQEYPTYFVKEQVYIRYVHLCSLCWAKIYCL